MERALAGMAALDKMSPPTGKEGTSHVENRTSNTGMSMKTKDRCGKLEVNRECYRKQRYLHA